VKVFSGILRVNIPKQIKIWNTLNVNGKDESHQATDCFFCLYRLMFSHGQVAEKAGKPVPESYCISGMEFKLYTMINSYRQRYDLPPIPLSKSLCFVASEHVKDLFFHHPDQDRAILIHGRIRETGNRFATRAMRIRRTAFGINQGN